MRLLIATDVFPSPLDRGDRVRMRNILEACAREFDLTLICPRPGGNVTDVALGNIRTILVDQEARGPRSQRLVYEAMRTHIGMPAGKTLARRLRFLEALERIDLNSFDLIWAQRPHIGRLFTTHCSKTIVDFDDVTHVKFRRLVRLQRPSVDLIHNLYRYSVYRHAELHLFRGYLGIAVCSEEDRDYLRAQKAGNVFVVPNGVEIHKEPGPPSPRRAGDRLRLVFLGNMEHHANVDAVDYFVTQVLPGSRTLIESLDVIGPNVPQKLRDKCGSAVNFLGFRADLSHSLAKYDAMIAPIRFGSGTKLKVLEGMANGLPLVLTPCAAEGLQLVDGMHALVVTTTEDMVAALTKLLRSPDLCRSLAAAARDLAERRFSWSAIQSALAGTLREVASPAAGMGLGQIHPSDCF